jgi:hypothetical protein
MGGRLRRALLVRTNAAEAAVAHLTTMVGRPSDPNYRKTIVRMLHSGALPHDIMAAVKLGVEIAIDAVQAEIAKEEHSVKRTD